MQYANEMSNITIICYMNLECCRRKTKMCLLKYLPQHIVLKILIKVQLLDLHDYRRIPSLLQWVLQGLLYGKQGPAVLAYYQPNTYLILVPTKNLEPTYNCYCMHLLNRY